MKKYQLANVSSPNIQFEVGGKIETTKMIKNASKNPNFDVPTYFLDVVRSALKKFYLYKLVRNGNSFCAECWYKRKHEISVRYIYLSGIIPVLAFSPSSSGKPVWFKIFHHVSRKWFYNVFQKRIGDCVLICPFRQTSLSERFD